jgi:hypothetical protein
MVTLTCLLLLPQLLKYRLPDLGRLQALRPFRDVLLIHILFADLEYAGDVAQVLLCLLPCNIPFF